MIQVPYFNGSIETRDEALDKIRQFMADTDITDGQEYQRTVNDLVISLWRAAYSGGDHSATICLFGDWLRRHVIKYYSKFADIIPPRRRQGKWKIGYVSQNMRNQAVALYSVNRIIHADRERFDTFCYSLGEHRDPVADLYRQHSCCFKSFAAPYHLDQIAEAVRMDGLDLLIFTDIGMDAATYQLAALKLAPVQATLVGHGATTGLATMDYYISGDHEPANAQNHYREKLVRLPLLGAAQYVLPADVAPVSRREYGIPDDAVVYVSMANGIKWGPERDSLLIELLQSTKKAVIVMKPFIAPGHVQQSFVDRVKGKAIAAGVDNRLHILPPLPSAAHMAGWCAIADVQLDTYPYGGWTTNLEAIAAGLPIVTQQGNLARNRWGAGFLQAMGITNIARNENEWLGIAQAMARESARGAAARITQQHGRIFFDGAGAQAAYDNVLEHICKSAEPTGEWPRILKRGDSRA